MTVYADHFEGVTRGAGTLTFAGPSSPEVPPGLRLWCAYPAPIPAPSGTTYRAVRLAQARQRRLESRMRRVERRALKHHRPTTPGRFPTAGRLPLNRWVHVSYLAD